MLISPILVLFSTLAISLCDVRELKINTGSNHRTVNRSSEFRLDIGHVKGTIFIKVKARDDSPMVTVSGKSIFSECPTQNRMALCVMKNFAPQKTVKVSVFCIKDCRFKIEAFHSQYYRMELQDQFMVMFKSDEDTFSAEIGIPHMLPYTELKILALVDNPESVKGEAVLFASMAPNKPTPTNFQYKSQAVWNEGRTITLAKKIFEPRDKLRIYLSGAKDMRVLLACFWMQHNIRRVSLGQTVYDDVRAGSSKTYMLELGQGTYKGSTSIKFTQHTGKCEVKITADGKRDSPMLDGTFTDSMMQFTITDQLKMQLGINQTCYIEVIAEQHSTFMLRADFDNEDYVVLDDDVTITRSILTGEVNNYIYYLVAQEQTDGQDNIREFTLGAEVTGGLAYGIKRCDSLEKGNVSCSISTVSDAISQEQAYQNIRGINHTDSLWRSFRFFYDIKNCTAMGSNQRICVFHIICYNPIVHETKQTIQYQLHFEQTVPETVLQQGISKRDHLSENQTKNYVFSLKETDHISQVRFVLSVISGDCLLSGSINRTNHTFENDEVRFAFSHTLKYTGTVNRQYFLVVHSFSNSYYSLLAQTLTVSSKQHNLVNASNPVRLSAGVTQNVLLEEWEKSALFLVHLTSPKQFYVQVNSLQANTEIEVYTSKELKPTDKYLWHSTNNFVKVSYPNNTATPYLEFLVVIRSKVDKFFSIVYNEWGRCAPCNVNQPLQMDIPKGSLPRCFEFYLNRLAPLMLVAIDSYFDRGTGQNAVFFEWNNLKEEIITSRITTYSVKQLLQLCPGLKDYSKGNYSACILKVKIQTERATSLTLAVQYVDQQVQLFDGLQVFINNHLSQTKAIHFHYAISDTQTPILVSLRTSTDTRYRMVARLVQWREYFEAATSFIYPLFNDETGLMAETSHTGSTALIVKPSAMESTNTSEKLLLVSLFAPNSEEQEAEFKIEVVQHTVPLTISQLKTGFVDKQASRKYSISANSDEELIVHVNTLVPNCAKLQLYNIGKNDQAAALSQSLTNELLISPTRESRDYVVEVAGLESCSYEISYSTSQQRIYELVVGHAFGLDFKANDRVYFLYFNSRNETFRVVAMVDHGFVSYRAKSMLNANLSDLSALVDKATKDTRWEFGETNHDISLTVSKDSTYFCVGCYYLIEVSTEQAASVTLLLHSKSSAIPLKENRYLRETLLPAESIKYAYLKLAPFKLAFTVIFGTPIATVTLTSNATYNTVFNVTESKDYLVPYDGPGATGESVYQSDAFLIEVFCQESCSYSMLVDSSDIPRRLDEGLPYKLAANSQLEQCVQFVSLTGSHSTHLLLQSSNTSNLNYTISCSDRSVRQKLCNTTEDLIIKATVNQNHTINIKLRSLDGIYKVCFKSINEQMVTILHSIHSEYRVFPTKVYSLITLTEQKPNSTIRMEQLSGQQILVQVFECTATIDFFSSNEYAQLQSGESINDNYVMVAGHYTAVLPLAESYSYQFARVQLPSIIPPTSVSLNYRYSYFPIGKNPYSSVSLSSQEIEYNVHDSKVTFQLPVVDSEGIYTIKTAQYFVLLSSEPGQLKDALQCNKKPVLMKSSKRTLPSDMQNIGIVFTEEQIVTVVGQSKQYFVGGYCQVEIEEDHATNFESLTLTYKLIYDTTQMVLVGSSQPLDKKAEFIFLWIIFPALLGSISVMLLVKHCSQRIRRLMAPQGELMQQANPRKEKPSENVETQGSTVKNIVVFSEADMMQSYPESRAEIAQKNRVQA